MVCAEEHGARCSPGRRLAARCLLGILWLCLAAAAFDTTRLPGSFEASRAKPTQPYAWHTQAWIHGQAALLVKPDPRLMALPNPYDPAKNRSYGIIDFSYRNGKYYLYYGVTPILTLFLPWKAVFNTYPTDAFAVAVYASLAYALHLCLLYCIWARYLPRTPLACLVLAALLVGWGNLDPLHWEWTGYTIVAQECGYACLAAMLLAGYHTLHARGRVGLGLALTSLATGLTVASRPSLLPVGLFLAAVTAYLGWHAWKTRGDRPSLLHLALAACMPFGLIVASMLAYNAVRFGSPLEFGMHYQIEPWDMPRTVLSSVNYVSRDLKAFLFSGPRFVSQFPFIIGGTALPIGLVVALPFLVFLLGCLWAPAPQPPRLRVFGAGLVATGLGAFAILSTYFLEWMRYETDAAMPLTVAAAIGWLILVDGARRPWLRRAFIAFGVGLGLYTLAVNVQLYAFSYPAPGRLALLAGRLNAVSDALEARYAHFGPVELSIQWPASLGEERQPLLKTGWDAQDVVYARQSGAGRVIFGFDHVGAAGPESVPIPLDPTVPHKIRILSGALLPVATAPFFDGYSPTDRDVFRHRLVIQVDGRSVVDVDSDLFGSDSLSVRVGSLSSPLSGYATAFSGRILKVEHLPFVPSEWLHPDLSKAWISMKVRFRDIHSDALEPIVSTGQNGMGDMLCVHYSASGPITYSMVNQQGASVGSEAFPIRPGDDHVLQMYMGSLAAHDPKPWIILYVDGDLALKAPWTYQHADPRTVAFGFNGWGFNSAQRTFSGTISSIAPAAPREIVSWDASLAQGVLVQLKLRFPSTASAIGRPIIQTGVPGMSDLIYMQVVSAHSVRFGFDHWGFGAFVGKSMEVDLGAVHMLALSVSSWNREGFGVGGHAKVTLTCDGNPVIDATLDTYPWTRGQLFLLANANGASTADPTFDGRLLDGKTVFPVASPAP